MLTRRHLLGGLLAAGGGIIANHLPTLYARAAQTPEPPPLAPRLTDTFTDTDGVSLGLHILDEDAYGAGWLATAGAFTTQNGTAVAGAATCEAVHNTPHSDGILTCRVKAGSTTVNHAPGLVFRGADATHYWLAYLAGNGTLTLYERIGNTFHARAATTWAADTDWHTLTVAYNGDDVTVQLDADAPLLYTMNGGMRGCQVGIRGFKYGGVSDAFDDFQFDVSADHLPAPFPAGEPDLAGDSFDGENGGSLTARGWTTLGGAWAMQSGRVRQSQIGNPAIAGLLVRDIETPDFALEVKISTPASGKFITGLYFRGAGDSYLEAEINNSPAYVGYAGFGLWSYNGASPFIPVMHRYFVPQNSATYTMRVQARGSLLTAELVEAGLLMIGTSDLLTDATQVGLFEARDSLRLHPNAYNDFKAWAL